MLYNFVFKCNAAIEGLTRSTTLTPAVKQQLLGEAKFMQAFMYFYLVNEFGDVPLALTTDPQANTLLARSPQAKVYEQIITDLLEAEQQLSNDYLDVTLVKTLQRECALPGGQLKHYLPGRICTQEILVRQRLNQPR
ncbi:RagB/SusD family nutrient uptake outer membrane protein [Paraflavitalea speifideaquila]|uniref:RagB/SusD family nutrient uptake outer membrane protein n=1 Tax=Paraflavitalea speifideaquila TaxID=3076558 RepID=UPI0028EE4AF6|nr:RagB/SusD family nutrient uptake outer membrane protein [Paraflavitalea speifideiaquila]